MRFKKLDLNLLVALDALLTEESISRAARRQGMSQPAMSGALARLRDYFDDQLLVQVGRQMEMTPRGEVLRSAVRDVLARVDTTIAAQPDFDPSTSDREFRLVVSDYTLATLAPYLHNIVSEQSGTLRLKWMSQLEMPQRVLERGDADLILHPSIFCATEHPSEQLLEEVYCCVVWSGSKHVVQPLTRELYAEADHAVMQIVEEARSFESLYLQRLGLTRKIKVKTPSFASLPTLILNTQLIATVHKRIALIAQRNLPVTILDLPVAFPVLEQSMQWHKYRTQDPGLVWLRESLHAAVLKMDCSL